MSANATLHNNAVRLLPLVPNSEIREAALFKGVADTVIGFDSGGKCLFYCAGLGPNWPFARKDLVGHNLDEFFPHELVPDLHAASERSRSLGTAELLKLQLKTTSGQVQSFEARIVAAGEDETFVFLREMTAFCELIASVQTSEARYRSLIDNLPQAFFAKDLEGRYIFANAQYARLIGIPCEQIIGRKDEQLFSAAMALKFKDEDLKVLTTKKPIHATESQELPNGRKACIQMLKAPVLDGTGKIIGIQATLWDVTDRLQLESQLRQIQKLDSIGRLSGAIAHDFNNILTVIQGHAQILRLQKNLSPNVEESLKAIEGAVTRAANLTRPLLTFSRKQAFHPVPTELGGLIKDFSRMLRRVFPENIRFELDLAENPVGILADSSMLEQVLLNFAVNSRDAMPDGGEIRVKSYARKLTEENLRMHPQAQVGEFAVIEFSDTGSGIPPEILPQIFEPFFTTKEVGRGTGLGLATVYGIVQQHSGWIEVDSELGRGGTFRIFLPIENVTPSESQREPENELLSGIESVLVVEDEEPVRTFLATMLRGQGYDVQVASCASEAIRLWDEAARPFDLLLTDMVLAEEASGRDLALRLLEQKPNLKILIFSGYMPDDAGNNLQRSGIEFLSKPAPVDRLLKHIRQLLEEKN